MVALIRKICSRASLIRDKVDPVVLFVILAPVGMLINHWWNHRAQNLVDKEVVERVLKSSGFTEIHIFDHWTGCTGDSVSGRQFYARPTEDMKKSGITEKIEGVVCNSRAAGLTIQYFQ
jgi:hypothetical protein